MFMTTSWFLINRFEMCINYRNRISLRSRIWLFPNKWAKLIRLLTRAMKTNCLRYKTSMTSHSWAGYMWVLLMFVRLLDWNETLSYGKLQVGVATLLCFASNEVLDTCMYYRRTPRRRPSCRALISTCRPRSSACCQSPLLSCAHRSFKSTLWRRWRLQCCLGWVIELKFAFGIITMLYLLFSDPDVCVDYRRLNYRFDCFVFKNWDILLDTRPRTWARHNVHRHRLSSSSDVTTFVWG